MITQETRNESHKEIKKETEMRYGQILNILKGNEMTAKEIAIKMYLMHLIPSDDRNFSAPRLTELVKKGRVKVVGKKICQWSRKKVAIYKVT